MWALRALRNQDLAPDIVSFNAAMNACEKAQQWQAALAVFEASCFVLPTAPRQWSISYYITKRNK